MCGNNMSLLFHILDRTVPNFIQIRKAHQLMQNDTQGQPDFIILTNIQHQRIDKIHLSSLFLKTLLKLDLYHNWHLFFIL